MSARRLALLGTLLAWTPSPAAAQHGGLPVDFFYKDHWLTARSAAGDYQFRLQHRFQFRLADPFDPDPRSIDDLNQEQTSFMIRRARLKFEGYTYRPWITWYLQYDWSQPVLRDYSLTLKKFTWFRVWVGRGKVVWNDERVSSSGRQQFVNRSIVNDLFTVDRQQGIQISGRLFPETWGDLTYSVGAFTGEGISNRSNDDRGLMYAARLQWNLFGRELAFSQSDVEYHAQPTASLAVGVAHNRTRCTAFETDARSCRVLPTLRADGSAFPDIADTRAGQFEVNQLVAEFRLKWRGLYAKHEQHWKQVTDHEVDRSAAARETKLRGSISQLGYFPHHLISAIPEPLEIAGRFARVNPEGTVSHNLQTEVSGVLNWFFDGHENKLSLELSRLSVEEAEPRAAGTANRVRLQWDTSF